MTLPQNGNGTGRHDGSLVENILGEPLASPFPAGFTLADPDSFRAFMGAFPTGVAIVTTISENGEPLGFTCSSLCSVSLMPPSLLVCVHRASTTLMGVHASGRFAVNLLGDRGQVAMALS
ncbi:MAG: flavin reductase family protein [Actinomycetota bacterium]|nr:flavin reductase family protein [Actinomycetota bacterium]